MPRSAMPALAPEVMAAVDRAMFESCDLDVVQVMEVAGRAVAVFARQVFFQGNSQGKTIIALCGPGGNGGDALVAARYLAEWGARVTIWLAAEPREGSPASHNLRIARTLGIPEEEARAGTRVDLIVDGLLGFSSRGAPTGRIADLVSIANGIDAPLLAIDLPTGLEPATGEIQNPCLHAAATLTLGLPKTGLIQEFARNAVGDLYVADIGIPARAFEHAGVSLQRVEWRSDWIRLEG
jgi:NAD(P)H-hydrate epimerase